MTTALQENPQIEQVNFQQYMLAQSISECLHQSGLMIDTLLLEVEQVLQLSLVAMADANPLASTRMQLAIDSITSNKHEIRQHFIDDLSARLNYIAYIHVDEKPHSRSERRHQNRSGITKCIEIELAATKIANDISIILFESSRQVNQYYSLLRGLSLATCWSNIYKPELFVFAIVNAMEAARIDPDSIDILIHGTGTRLHFELHKLYARLISFAEQNNLEKAPHEDLLVKLGPSGGECQTIADRINRMILDESLTTTQAIRPPLAKPISAEELTELAQAIAPSDVSETKFMTALDHSFPGVQLASLRSMLINGAEHRKFTSEQRLTMIDKITGLLIDAICEDPRLLGAVRSEVAKLKQHLQRTAVADSTFITNHAHPMRLFIELICHKSLAFKSETDAGFAGFIVPLRRAIKAYLNSKSTSLKLIQDWLEKKWAGAVSTVDISKAHDESVFEQSRARNLHAYQIRNDIHAKYNPHAKYPPFICIFVDGPWCNLIAHLEISEKAIKGSIESAHKTLHNLFWSCDLKSISNDLSTFCKFTSKIPDEIKSGMSLLGVTDDNIEVSLFLTLLKKHYSNLLINAGRVNKSLPVIDFYHGSAVTKPRRREDTDVWLTTEEKRVIGHIQADRQANQETTDFMSTVIMADVAQQDTRKIISNPDELIVNSWLEVKTDDSWQRMLLKWKGDGLFMFVKASGESVSMTARQFDKLNQEFRVAVLIERGFMSEALEKLLKQ